MTHTTHRLATAAQLFAVLCLAPLGLQAQTPAAGASPARSCTSAEEMTPANLYGLWSFTLSPMEGSGGAPQVQGSLLFERHPEYPGSVRGNLILSRAGQESKAVVSGDVTGGEFNLDESADGVSMTAVWTGDVPASGCGLEIRGVRRPANGGDASEPSLQFVLKKTPGWR